MPKKILAILATARTGGNTNALLEHCAKGAEEMGAQVEVLPIGTAKIAGCLGCDFCRNNHALCIQKDDMQPLYQKLQKADAVVLACPVYYGSYTAQLKAFIDRLYCLTEKRPKKCALLLTAGGGAGENCACAISSYQIAAQYLNWQDQGYALADQVDTPAQVHAHPACAQAYRLGRALAQ